MKGRKATLNELHREGIIFRELNSPSGAGFVLRLVNRDVTPRQITTVAKQPGHRTVSVETIIPEGRLGLGPEGFLPVRYSAVPTYPESLDAVIARLEGFQTAGNSLAQVALSRLLADY